MNCKDCLYYEVCKAYSPRDSWATQNCAEECVCFTSRSEWVHLPCKVGDTVYIPWHWNGEQGVAFTTVEEIKFYNNNHFLFFIQLQSDDEDYNETFGEWKEDGTLGKTVFLTREEAEKALKECEKE